MMEAENDGLPPLPRPMYDVADLAYRRKQLQTQQSTVATRRQQAVCVRRAVKVYGPKNNQNVVLDGLNMTVPKGTIYGLLGASGCGKTTLLSCIVGRRRLNSGEIWVLGGRPGSRGSGVPGPRIGYMPQEVALYGEFSIKETMTYFGWVAGMTTSQIGDRTEFLVKLLQLPSSSRFVKNLSGGQQRRVSLAAALINTPELLILDEPTVGVDPVLRQGIWDHLVDITSGGKTTVIVTTHYIEETRQAHVIGLMRGGRFLAEESPDNLMARYGTETLEDVFLKLAVMQNAGKRRRSSIVQEVSTTIQIPPVTDPAALHLDEDEAGEISGEFGDNVSMGGRVSIVPEAPHASLPLPPEDEVPPFTCWDNFKVLKPNHMQALIWKNLLWMWRNVGAMCFIIGLPVVQVVIFCMSIGRDPTGLKLSISNHELNSSALGLYGNMGDNMAECPVIPGCNYTTLSCRYLKHLRDRTVDTVIYGSDEEALEAVRRGYAWGALIFGDNFTESLVERAEAGRDAPDWIIESAAIQVRLDMSNQQIGTLLYRDIQYAFMDFVELLYTDCGINPKVAKLPPLKMHTPIYGDKIPNFTDFAAPGIILTVIFFLAVALTSGAMLLERNEGMLERSLVTGITGTEILFSHVVTQFLVMCFQTLLVLICCFAVFSLTCRGAMGWVAVLTILTGLCGMCFGFVVSVSCENERSATYMAIGSFLPVVMLCGIIWPVEGMNWVLKYISYVLPLTKSTESLRSILQRGWSIQTPDVYQGFLMTLVWIIVFLTVSILVLKFKKG